ncbi:MAG: AAA family ATPase [Candidatus Pacebacteria bacterium]|nr:AAA family ATPase [Candidatus Paceibacterota bacterium]
MIHHITLRLAWHNDGWNGHICKNPKENTYCIGRYSYPGDQIQQKRDLDIEEKIAGKPCSQLQYIPPCAFSINAFGKNPIKAFAEPPGWFRDGSEGIYMDIPPATACIWPYGEMYSDDVQRESSESQKYNYDKRLQNAKDYFANLKKDKTLIFYYANYSNPFSEDENQKYVVVGISRLKDTGKIQYYKNVSEEYKKKYAGGFVWQMPITSHYPEQGFRIPYEKYLDNPAILQKILFIPDNPRNFKYATRPFNNDDALSLVERFLEVVKILIDMGDDTQNWHIRKDWLLGLLSELWKNRGCYPGLPEILRVLDFEEGIQYYKEKAAIGLDKEAYTDIKKFITAEISQIEGLKIDGREVKELQRNWKLREKDEQKLLLEILPKFDLTGDQVGNILSGQREENGLDVTLKEICENPYLLYEKYLGDDQDDYISFNKIDHGILPSPELGSDIIFSKNSAERFRALCVEQLKKEEIHSFVSSTAVLAGLNNKLSFLPEWKQYQFTPKYFEVDQEFIEKIIQIRNQNNQKFLYLKTIYDDERFIQNTIESMVQRPDIQFKVPMTEQHFYNFLKDPQSQLLQKAPDKYDEVLKAQANVCQQIFTKPICVISGAAGTGKTTIIKSLIKAIEKVHGPGSAFYLMAPTGKAADRIKAKTLKTASTIHSFLASKGWLNENFSYKRRGGQKETSISTLIIDECSMIDLELFATLFRVIDWHCIQRLVMIGDPNQLPPIGRGKVFSDIIEWLKKLYPENVGKLAINVRQLENAVFDRGKGILELADIFIQEQQKEENFDKTKLESMLKRVQEGGVVDKDLRIIYWTQFDELESLMRDIIIEDLENDSNVKLENDKTYLLWDAACKKKDGKKRATYMQVLSPYRGEVYGTENLNLTLQKLFNKYQAQKATLDGIAIFDKVIQYRNRPKSDPISAYDLNNRKPCKIDIYNGEIGFVKPHPFDNEYWKKPYFVLRKFQVVFDRKENYWVNFGYCEDKKGKLVFSENVEENLELGYVISVHKAQGSEFDRVYCILPRKKSVLLSMELLYTAITRAQHHLTVFAQDDVSVFQTLSRIESSILSRINSSLFEFNPLSEELLTINSWYEEGKVVSTLTEYFVRSKSEMNIANILHLKNIPFTYETPLFAPDGTMYLPDFTISWQGERYYWEHVGRLDLSGYQNHWQAKKSWYDKHFPGRLIVTYESEFQSKEIEKILKEKFNI